MADVQLCVLSDEPGASFTFSADMKLAGLILNPAELRLSSLLVEETRPVPCLNDDDAYSIVVDHGRMTLVVKDDRVWMLPVATTTVSFIGDKVVLCHKHGGVFSRKPFPLLFVSQLQFMPIASAIAKKLVTLHGNHVQLPNVFLEARVECPLSFLVDVVNGILVKEAAMGGVVYMTPYRPPDAGEAKACELEPEGDARGLYLDGERVEPCRLTPHMLQLILPPPECKRVTATFREDEDEGWWPLLIEVSARCRVNIDSVLRTVSVPERLSVQFPSTSFLVDPPAMRLFTTRIESELCLVGDAWWYVEGARNGMALVRPHTGEAFLIKSGDTYRALECSTIPCACGLTQVFNEDAGVLWYVLPDGRHKSAPKLPIELSFADSAVTFADGIITINTDNFTLRLRNVS